MLRTALQPRQLLLLAVALAAATLCAWAGNWQWERAREDAPTAQAITDRPARPLSDVLAPQQTLTGDALSTPVTTSGVYQPEDMVMVSRTLHGRDGVLVVVPLRVSGEAGLPRLAVVLGWRPAGDAGVLDVPEGRVNVSGVLQQPDEPGPPPEGDVYQSLSTAQLVNRWKPPMYTAYLLNLSETPGLTQVPMPDPPRQGLALQNLSYALQWFVFAGFAVFLWWRMVRDAHDDQLEAAEDGGRERQPLT